MMPSSQLANFRFCRLLNFFLVKDGCVVSRLPEFDSSRPKTVFFGRHPT
jgi:hypothetical protein